MSDKMHKRAYSSATCLRILTTGADQFQTRKDKDLPCLRVPAWTTKPLLNYRLGHIKFAAEVEPREPVEGASALRPYHLLL